MCQVRVACSADPGLHAPVPPCALCCPPSAPGPPAQPARQLAPAGAHLALSPAHRGPPPLASHPLSFFAPGDREDTLMEMSFYVPRDNRDMAMEAADGEDGAAAEAEPAAKVLFESISRHTDTGAATGDAVVTFDQVGGGEWPAAAAGVGCGCGGGGLLCAAQLRRRCCWFRLLDHSLLTCGYHSTN